MHISVSGLLTPFICHVIVSVFSSVFLLSSCWCFDMCKLNAPCFCGLAHCSQYYVNVIQCQCKDIVLSVPNELSQLCLVVACTFLLLVSGDCNLICIVCSWLWRFRENISFFCFFSSWLNHNVSDEEEFLSYVVVSGLVISKLLWPPFDFLTRIMLLVMAAYLWVFLCFITFLFTFLCYALKESYGALYICIYQKHQLWMEIFFTYLQIFGIVQWTLHTPFLAHQVIKVFSYSPSWTNYIML